MSQYGPNRAPVAAGESLVAPEADPIGPVASRRRRRGKRLAPRRRARRRRDRHRRHLGQRDRPVELHRRPVAVPGSNRSPPVGMTCTNPTPSNIALSAGRTPTGRRRPAAEHHDHRRLPRRPGAGQGTSTIFITITF